MSRPRRVPAVRSAPAATVAAALAAVATLPVPPDAA